MTYRLYPKLALEGMRKNRKLYLPYLLTCGGMVMMDDLFSFLVHDANLEGLPFMDSLQMILNMGYWVIAIFAAFFLFYTNSFLMRRRKREFGLYHVLGMGKGALGHILFWENLYTAAAALGGGILAGVALSKLFELGLMHLMEAQVNDRFSVSFAGIWAVCRTFLPIFLLLFLNALRQIRFSSTRALLESESEGEKPPKANWLLGLSGAVLLGFAYYLALVVADPVNALTWFFVAVILVILATYLLMVFGSVLICRVLQKNKGYYYQAKHFVSISSMAYRMHRNGKGLASVCILATMVLVTLSSTACLYFGMEGAIAERYAREISVQVSTDRLEDLTDCAAWVREDIAAYAPEENVEIQNDLAWTAVIGTGYWEGEKVSLQDPRIHSFTPEAMSHICNVQLVSLADYNTMMGKAETLEEGQVLAYGNRGISVPEHMNFGGVELRVKRVLDHFVSNRLAAMDVIPTMTLVTSDLPALTEKLKSVVDETEREDLFHYAWFYCFDTGLDEAAQREYWMRYAPPAEWSEAADRFPGYHVTMESRALDRQDFLTLYGGLFYLGSMLSLVFLCAAVLILYYKQLSEGDEDQARFAIMRKVGMTQEEIRQSVNSQLLTVFFLPLLLAGCHLLFAFPMVRKIMLVFNLSNTGLFLTTAGVCYGVFALLYALVYRLTSHTYFRMVSGAKEEMV